MDWKTTWNNNSPPKIPCSRSTLHHHHKQPHMLPSPRGRQQQQLFFSGVGTTIVDGSGSGWLGGAANLGSSTSAGLAQSGVAAAGTIAANMQSQVAARQAIRDGDFDFQTDSGDFESIAGDSI